MTDNDNIAPAVIHGIRIVLGLTQAAFAVEMHVKTVTVQKWEAGIYKPGGPAVVLMRQLEAKGAALVRRDYRESFQNAHRRG